MHRRSENEASLETAWSSYNTDCIIVASKAAEAIHIDVFKKVVLGPVDLVAPLEFFRRDDKGDIIRLKDEFNPDFTVSWFPHLTSFNSALVSERYI